VQFALIHNRPHVNDVVQRCLLQHSRLGVEAVHGIARWCTRSVSTLSFVKVHTPPTGCATNAPTRRARLVQVPVVSCTVGSGWCNACEHLSDTVTTSSTALPPFLPLPVLAPPLPTHRICDAGFEAGRQLPSGMPAHGELTSIVVGHVH